MEKFRCPLINNTFIKNPFAIIFALHPIMSPLIKSISAGSTSDYRAKCSGCDFDDLLCMEIVRESMLKCWETTNNGFLDNEAGFSLVKEGSAYAAVFSRND